MTANELKAGRGESEKCQANYATGVRVCAKPISDVTDSLL